MQRQDELLEVLPSYLRERFQFSDEALQSLLAEWDEQGNLIEFLVGKGLLTRPTARALTAVSQGHFNSPLAAVLGLAAQSLPIIAGADELWGSERLELELAATAPQPIVHPPHAGTAPPIAPPESRPVAPPTRPMTGMQLGPFILEEQLGSGFAGTVFRSFHPKLRVPVAIKVFDPFDLSDDNDAHHRFLREAQTLSRLRHPHIVRILEVEIHERFPYLVMEYVGERTLASQITTMGKLPAPRVAEIGRAVARALDFTWQQGLLHRDVKPANILERRDGRIKLGDFGLSAERAPDGGLRDREAELGYISGTPSFIAPEQAMTPNDIDFRADMYALGATLYNAAVGSPPFSAATAYDTITAQLNTEPLPITQLEPGFDANLAAAIHRMLQRDRQDRFSSWAAVLQALA